MSTIRTHIKMALATLGVIGGTLALASAPALATTIPRFRYQYQLTGFSAPEGAAFDTGGDLYVADFGGALDKFNTGAPAAFSGSAEYINGSQLTGTPEGAFGGPAGVAVDAAGNIYVTDYRQGAVDVFDPEGIYQHQLTGIALARPQGIAVDRATGDVYVADPGNGVVDVFDSAGVYQSQFGSGILREAFSVAVNEATGEVYVGETGARYEAVHVVYVFSSAGVLQATWTGSGNGPGGNTPNGSFGGTLVFVAVDPTTHDVYVAAAGEEVVDVFDASGNYLTQITGKETPSGAFGGHYAVQGIAVDSSGNVYVLDHEGDVVDVFRPRQVPPPAPTAVTGEASAVTADSATIAGSVNPGGNSSFSETTYYFEYGTTTAYSGGRIPLASGNAGVGTNPVSETANLTGLELGTTYYYQIVATNNQTGEETQTSKGGIRTFTTPGTPPVLGATAASAITQTTATIASTLDAQGLPTRYELQLGSTPGSLGYAASGDTSSATTEPLALSATGLLPGTTYYYKLLAVNQDGTVETPEASFATAAAPGALTSVAGPATPLFAVPTDAFPKETAGSTTTTTPAPRALSNAQKLANALKACRKKPKGRRALCERQARNRYRPAKGRKK
jgi:DNA-binding beta-propeller fold protein YncE